MMTVEARTDAILLQYPSECDRALLRKLISEGLRDDRRAMNQVLQGILAEMALANDSNLAKVRAIVEAALYQC